MRLVVVGERMNLPTWRPRYWPDVHGDRHWRLMLRLGAFRDARSRAKLASLGLAEYDSINLLPPDPQGTSWDAEKAEEVAVTWMEKFRAYDQCLLAGARVARAFHLGGGMGRLMGKSTCACGVRVVVIPHPSGLNRFWNSRIKVDSLSERLTILLRVR
jgi:hypothetical protein